jgi:hypothetical protein
MEDYTVFKSSTGGILSIFRNKEPKASIPVCNGNTDYQLYLEDLELRGEPYPEEIINGHEYDY